MSDPDPNSVGSTDAAPPGPSGRADRRDIHHVAFEVPSVSDAIGFFGATFGAGPFYRLIDPHGGDPGHVGPGFGSWGGIFVELMEAGSADGGAPRLDHVAYMTSEPEAESMRLAELGMAKFQEFRMGQVWPQFHDASASLGCAVEIHQACSDLDEFFEMVAGASVGWDGSEPERLVQAPGTPGFHAPPVGPQR